MLAMRNRCYEIGWDVAPSVQSSPYSSWYSRSSSVWFLSESAYDRFIVAFSDVYRIAQRRNENSKEPNALKQGFIV